jgi:hypothetical protein
MVKPQLSQEEAEQRFQQWARQASPLGKAPSDYRVSFHMLPFWVFSARVNVLRAGGVPVSLPYLDRDTEEALQVYAGHAFPRNLMHTLKNDPADIRAFDANALPRNVQLETFSVYEATAFTHARAALLQHLRQTRADAGIEGVDLRSVTSRRVLMPAFVVQYRFFGTELRAFVNGHTGAVYGVEQSIFGSGGSLLGAIEKLPQLLAQLATVLRTVNVSLDPRAVAALGYALVGFLRPFAKILLWPPFLVGSMAAFSTFAAYRVTRGVREQTKTFAEWEETRAMEQEMQKGMQDTWSYKPTSEQVDSDRARRQREREQERQREREAAEGERRRQQQQQSQQQQSQQQQRTQRSSESTAGYRMKWRVDTNDHYQVLGIADGGPHVTVAEIQTAFRKQLLQNHPDQQSDKAEALSQEEATERTRYIIASYGVLRDKAKRAAYDASYRRR